MTKKQNPNSQKSPLDEAPYLGVICDLILKGETNASIVRVLKQHYDVTTTKDSIRRFRARHGIQIPGVERAYTNIDGDHASAATYVKRISKHHTDGQRVRGPRDLLDDGVLIDPDQMLLERGLDPEEWSIESPNLNTWDGPIGDGNIATYNQVKFTAKRKVPVVIQPVRSEGWTPRKQAHQPKKKDRHSELVVICGDQHVPFHDQKLHGAFCNWLAVNQPVRGVVLGDFLDLPDISRHPADPENHSRVQEGLQTGYEVFRDYVNDSPVTNWVWMPGNHDERIRQYLLKLAPSVYDLKRVRTDEEDEVSAYSLSHLMRLDELLVDFVEPYGTFEDVQVELSQHLAVRHGWIVRTGSGSSALKTLEKTGYSIIVGHTHRQSIVHHTTHDINRDTTTLLGAESGCMCRIDSKRDIKHRRYPSYSVLPDWQQGWATAEIYPDGRFRVDLATFVNGNTLLWRDQRYEVD